MHAVLEDGQTIHMYFSKGKYVDGTIFYYVGLMVNGSRRTANDWFEGRRDRDLQAIKQTGRSMLPLSTAYRIMKEFMRDKLLPGEAIEVGWSDTKRMVAYRALTRVGFQMAEKGDEKVYYYKK